MIPGSVIRRAYLIAAFLVAACSLQAQDLGVTLSPFVTMDSERVYGTTLVGQQITSDLEAKVQDLASENKRIAAELEIEELALTEQRPTMEIADFRTLADAFDQKVQRIRAEQDAKQRELQTLRDGERQSFIDAIAPLLSEIALKHGAVAVFERRSILLSADSIDITQEVIDRIDAALKVTVEPSPAPEGDGAQPGPQIPGQDNSGANE